MSISVLQNYLRWTERNKATATAEGLKLYAQLIAPRPHTID